MDDRAFFSELLELLDTPEPETRTGSRRDGQLAPVTTKQTLDAMRTEAATLTQELERLRFLHTGGHSGSTVELALQEKMQRTRAEQQCKALREAVYRQTQFVRGLHSVFAAKPRFSTGLNLCRYLHHYTRLPRNRSSRSTEYKAHVLNERLHSAMDMICRETEWISMSSEDDTFAPGCSPKIRCDTVNDVEGSCVTCTTVYSVDTCDIGAVMRGVCVAVRDIITMCPSGHALNVARDVVDPDASMDRNLQYRVIGVRHRGLEGDDELLIESHTVTSFMLTDDYAVVVWDFVDDDEIHPATESKCLRRDTVGACLIRRELCEDGVERVAVRSMGTKRFRERGLSASSTSMAKFVCTTQESMHANEVFFRNIIVKQVSTEGALRRCHVEQ